MSLIVLPNDAPSRPDGQWDLVAVQPMHWFKGTNSCPLLIEARATSGERDRWVLKPVVRLGVGDSIKELIAYRLAERCGIPVPEYGVVNVAENRLHHLTGEVKQTLLSSLGPNFGTRFIPGLTDVCHTLDIPSARRSTACDIFAFDVGVENVDRRKENPNLLLGDRHLWAIDHQHTFAGCNPANSRADEWRHEILHRLMPGHFLSDVALRWLESYERMREVVTEFDMSLVDDLTADLPEVWLARGGQAYVERIRAFLSSLFKLWEDLLSELEGGAAA